MFRKLLLHFYLSIESIIFQITLRSINEVFYLTENNILESIVFNGYVDTINKKTGTDFTSCIISLMTSRNQFEKINLTQVSFKDCVLYLKGIFAGELYQLAPVQPGTILLGHDGPFHIAISDGKQILRGMELFHGKQGTGVYVEAKVKKADFHCQVIAHVGRIKKASCRFEGSFLHMIIEFRLP